MSIALPWRTAWVVDRRAGDNGRAGRYRVCWIDDRGHRRSLSYRTRKTAETARRLKESELNSWASPAGVRSWPDLITEYGIALAAASQGYQEMTARVLGRFQAICQPTQSNLITPAMCDQFIAARAAGQPPDAQGQARSVASDTLRRDHRMLSAFFNWCVDRHFMEANPMASVRCPSKVRRNKRAPRARDWIGLLRVLNDKHLAVHDPQAWYLMILLGVATGYRQAVLLHCYFGLNVLDREALAVLEARHRRDGGFCVVQLSDTRDGIGLLHTFTGKTLKETIVGLPKQVNDKIAVRIGELPAGTATLFPWARWQRKAWSRINRAAGCDFTFHNLRAASGTRAAIARAERAAADQLDHSSVRVTRDHYLDQEQIAAAVAIGQSLPRLPKLPPYSPRAVTRAMPGRRPRGTAPCDPPERTADPPAGDASPRAC